MIINKFYKEMEDVYYNTIKKFNRIYDYRLDQQYRKLTRTNNKKINEGWITREDGTCYNVFDELIKEEEARKTISDFEDKAKSDNLLIPLIKVNVPKLFSANFMNDYDSYWCNKRRKKITTVTQSQDYKNYKKLIYSKLEPSGIKDLINKDNSDKLKITLRIFTTNTRKDIDNCEKPIIDSIADFLGINDNKIKIKDTAIDEMKNKDDGDVFFFKIEKLSSSEIQNIKEFKEEINDLTWLTNIINI